MWRFINMTPDDVTLRSFIEIAGALYHVALHQNRNAVFMWSVEMCFILPSIMRSFYEAVIFLWLHHEIYYIHHFYVTMTLVFFNKTRMISEYRYENEHWMLIARCLIKRNKSVANTTWYPATVLSFVVAHVLAQKHISISTRFGQIHQLFHKILSKIKQG